MVLKYLPRLFQYEDNYFINLNLIEHIEPSPDPSIMRYWINGHIILVPIEAHEHLMQIYKTTIEDEEE